MKLSRRATHALRGMLPTPMETVVKSLIARWGVATAGWRMLPEIVIVGAQRSGTTTLFRLLSDHPQVVRPTVSKGAAYFDLNYERGWRWYRGHFPLRLTAWLRSRGRRMVTFESSGYYMFHPLAAGRIAADLPSARVVAMLRNPIDRAHSAHKHESRRGFEDLSFDEAIDKEHERTAGEAERLTSEPGYRSYEHQHHAYVGRGEYAHQIRRLIDALGPERVYVVDADRFFAAPSHEFARLCAWLGLEPPSIGGAVEAWNAAPRAAMDEGLRATLEEHFRVHNAELTQILHELPSWDSQDVPFQQRRNDPL